MPIHVRWGQGKQLAIALMYFGGAGLFQAIFIAHGQYVAGVGSTYIVTLLPVVATLCLAFAAGILYEAQLQAARSGQGRRRYQKQDSLLQRHLVLLPMVLCMLCFAGLYFAVFAIAATSNTILSAFTIAENSGAIGVLVIATILEHRIAPNFNAY